MKKATVNGVELEYAGQGSGEPVLLLSPGPFADGFLPLLSEQALAERYHMIRYHQRGQAGSTHSPMPVSFAQHAADAAALLGHLGIQRAHVAGHSTGAAIGLQLAVDHPDVVHTLAVLEPPLPSAPGAEKFFEKAGPALAAYGAGDREGAMARFLTVACSLDWETCLKVVEQHIPGGMAQAMADADTFFASYLPALSEWQFGPTQAAAIAQPVRSIVGTETEPFFAEGHSLLRSWFPQLDECMVEGVAHLLHIQHPAPVAQGLADFLARHPLAGA